MYFHLNVQYYAIFTSNGWFNNILHKLRKYRQEKVKLTLVTMGQWKTSILHKPYWVNFVLLDLYIFSRKGNLWIACPR